MYAAAPYVAKLAWERDAVVEVAQRQNFSVEIVLSNSERQIDRATKDMLTFASWNRLIGIVGGRHNNVCESTATVTAVLGIPQVAYGCVGRALANKVRYAYFLRLADSAMEEAAASVAAHWGFRRITAVAPDERSSLRIQDDFLRAAAARSIDGLAALLPKPPKKAEAHCKSIESLDASRQPVFAGSKCTQEEAEQLMSGIREGLTAAVQVHQTRIWFLACSKNKHCDLIIAAAWTALRKEDSYDALFGASYLWFAAQQVLYSQSRIFLDEAVRQGVGGNFFVVRFSSVGQKAGTDYLDFLRGVSFYDFPSDVQEWFRGSSCPSAVGASNSSSEEPPAQEAGGCDSAEELEARFEVEKLRLAEYGPALRAFDATSALLVAINQLLSQGMKPSEIKGTVMRDELINNVAFEGTSGPVSWTNTPEHWNSYRYGERRGSHYEVRWMLRDENILFWDKDSGVVSQHPTFVGDFAFKSGSTVPPVDGSPQPCGVDSYWALWPTGEFGCAPCPPGRVQPSALDSATDCMCGAGWFAVNASTCEICPPGTYTEDLNSASCSPCVAGSIAPFAASPSCERCPPGSSSPALGATACERCRPGTIAEAFGALVCTDCHQGRFATDPGSVHCVNCPLGLYAGSPGSSTCEVCPKGKTTLDAGAQSAGECVCFAGTYGLHGSGPCYKCTEGMLCDEVGQQEPFQVAGHSIRMVTDATGKSLFKVTRCRNKFECPGGQGPGACADGRHGLGCGHCDRHHYPTVNGRCEPCGRFTAAVVVSIIAALFLAGIVLVKYSVHADASRMGSHTISMLLSVGHMAFVAQVLGIYSYIYVEWKDPLASVLRALEVFSFNLESMRIQCVWPEDLSLLTFTLRLLSLPLFLITLAALTVALRMLGWERRGFFMSYLNDVGVSCFITYTAITMTVLVPFQCVAHPSGSRALASDPAVLCEGSMKYAAMVVLGVMGTLCGPLAFVALVAWITWQYPKFVASGRGLRALEKYRFLLQRFTHERYYYGLVYLSRNLTLPLIPVIFPDSAFVQLVALISSFIFSMCAVCRLLPWRTVGANVSELVCLFGLLVFGTCACLLLDISSIFMRRFIMWVAIVTVPLALTSSIFVVANDILHRIIRRQPYSIYLCYHREAVAALARLAKLKLESRSRGKVFLHADHPMDLAEVCETIRTRTKSVVTLLSSLTLEQSWCAAEITTAVSNQKHMVVIACTGFVPPTRDGLRHMGILWTQAQKQGLIAVGNFTKDTVVRAYKEVLSMPQLSLSRLSPMPMQDVIFDSLSQSCQVSTMKLHKFAPRNPVRATSPMDSDDFDEPDVLILGSSVDEEAFSTCEILRMLLQKRLQRPVCVATSRLELHGKRAGRLAYVLVALSRGLLAEETFADLMLVLSDSPAGLPEVVTALVDTGFQFASGLRANLARKGSREARLAEVYEKLLAILALPFTASAADAVIGAQADGLARRFRCKRWRQISAGVRPLARGRRDSNEATTFHSITGSQGQEAPLGLGSINALTFPTSL